MLRTWCQYCVHLPKGLTDLCQGCSTPNEFFRVTRRTIDLKSCDEVFQFYITGSRILSPKPWNLFSSPFTLLFIFFSPNNFLLIMHSVTASYDRFVCNGNLLHMLKELGTFFSSLYFPMLIKFTDRLPRDNFY